MITQDDIKDDPTKYDYSIPKDCVVVRGHWPVEAEPASEFGGISLAAIRESLECEAKRLADANALREVPGVKPRKPRAKKEKP